MAWYDEVGTRLVIYSRNCLGNDIRILQSDTLLLTLLSKIWYQFQDNSDSGWPTLLSQSHTYLYHSNNIIGTYNFDKTSNVEKLELE